MDTDAQLRKHLGEVLRVDSDFDAFCHDCFPAVFRRYSSGMDRTTKTTLLLQVVGRPKQIEVALKEWLHRLSEPKQRNLSRSTAYVTLLFIVSMTSPVIYQRTTQRSVPLQPSRGAVKQPPSSDQAHDSQPKDLDIAATPQLLPPVPLLQKLSTSPVECFEQKRSRHEESSRGGHSRSDKAITNIFTGNIATVVQNY